MPVKKVRPPPRNPQSLLRKRIAKYFDEVDPNGDDVYWGNVIRIDKIKSDVYYYIKYDDGDTEHVTWDELRDMISLYEEVGEKSVTSAAEGPLSPPASVSSPALASELVTTPTKTAAAAAATSTATTTTTTVDETEDVAIGGFPELVAWDIEERFFSDLSKVKCPLLRSLSRIIKPKPYKGQPRRRFYVLLSGDKSSLKWDVINRASLAVLLRWRKDDGSFYTVNNLVKGVGARLAAIFMKNGISYSLVSDFKDADEGWMAVAKDCYGLSALQWEHKFLRDVGMVPELKHLVSSRRRFYSVVSGERADHKKALLNLCLVEVCPQWQRIGMLDTAMASLQHRFKEEGVNYTLLNDFKDQGEEKGGVVSLLNSLQENETKLQLPDAQNITKEDQTKFNHWEDSFFDHLINTKYSYLAHPKSKFYTMLAGGKNGPDDPEKDEGKRLLLDICLKAVLPQWEAKTVHDQICLDEALDALQNVWESKGILFDVWGDFNAPTGAMSLLGATNDDSAGVKETNVTDNDPSLTDPLPSDPTPTYPNSRTPRRACTKANKIPETSILNLCLEPSTVSFLQSEGFTTPTKVLSCPTKKLASIFSRWCLINNRPMVSMYNVHKEINSWKQLLVLNLNKNGSSNIKSCLYNLKKYQDEPPAQPHSQPKQKQDALDPHSTNKSKRNHSELSSQTNNVPDQPKQPAAKEKKQKMATSDKEKDQSPKEDDKTDESLQETPIKNHEIKTDSKDDKNTDAITVTAIKDQYKKRQLIHDTPEPTTSNEKTNKKTDGNGTYTMKKQKTDTVTEPTKDTNTTQSSSQEQRTTPSSDADITTQKQPPTTPTNNEDKDVTKSKTITVKDKEANTSNTLKNTPPPATTTTMTKPKETTTAASTTQVKQTTPTEGSNNEPSSSKTETADTTTVALEDTTKKQQNTASDATASTSAKTTPADSSNNNKPQPILV